MDYTYLDENRKWQESRKSRIAAFLKITNWIMIFGGLIWTPMYFLHRTPLFSIMGLLFLVVPGIYSLLLIRINRFETARIVSFLSGTSYFLILCFLTEGSGTFVTGEPKQVHIWFLVLASFSYFFLYDIKPLFRDIVPAVLLIFFFLFHFGYFPMPALIDYPDVEILNRLTFITSLTALFIITRHFVMRLIKAEEAITNTADELEKSNRLLEEKNEIIQQSYISLKKTEDQLRQQEKLALESQIENIIIQRERESAELNQQISETEMKALRAQMNPHFIFNSLNSINSYLVNHDNKSAREYLTKFAVVMRMILENSEYKEVSLQKDLHALELYMQLESLRMTNKFSYEIKVDDEIDMENTLIPPLILQPFVENSIWHGLARKEGEGKITIHIRKTGEMIECTVEDNGVGRKKSELIRAGHAAVEKKSLGMKITNARLDILNKIKKSKARVELVDLAEGIKVTMKLPLELRF